MSGFATANRFDLLIDENEDPSAIVQVIAKKAEKKPAASTPAQKSTAPAAPAANTAAPAQQPKGEKRNNTGAPRNNNQNKDRPRPPRDSEVAEGVQRTERPRRDAREPREPRERRQGAEGGQRRPRREGGDRHSGSGIRDGEKRQTVGKGNWGVPGEEVEATQEAEKSTDNLEAGAEKPSEPSTPVVESPAPAEPEDKSKTFSEYLAERGSVKPVVALPPARKANEGVDDSKWKNTVVLQKVEEAYYAKEDSAAAAKAKKVKPTKQQIEFEPRFDNGQRERTERRGRGNRGGRPNSTGSRQKSAPAPNLLDESAFPTLATK